jgi:hypothetical protein
VKKQIASKVGLSVFSDLNSRFESLPTRGILAIIAGVIIILSLVFLWPSFTEFPMDDTYIHFVYAQNLADQGKLIFNFAGERGVGTTSILWVLLLAAGYKVGIGFSVIAKILGIASLATVGMGLYLLLRSFWRPLPAFAGALLLAASGNMLWFALSGMETMLFLALGIVTLHIYQKEHWGWLGVSMGLLTLTRPEGLALALAIGLIELLRHRRITVGVLVSWLIFFLLCSPWFFYLFWRTGHLLSTSGIGKQFTSAVTINSILERTGVPILSHFTGLIYIGLWVAYLLEFALGGMALPAPQLTVGNVAGNIYTLSLWSIPGWCIVIALLFAAAKKLSAFNRWRYWIQDYARRPIVVLGVWAILHNLSYMVFLPIPGTASRYGAINYIVLWLALVGGLLCFVKHPRLLLGLTCGLIAIAVANMAYWNGVYDANLDHMQGVRIKAASFVHDTFSPDELCAALDVGAIRYFSHRPILDLGGLVDPDASQWFHTDSTDQYLVTNNVTCLVLPGQTGATEEGWFDFAKLMGLTSSPLIEMNLVKVFEIDHKRWLQGYLPTTNYQASVTIYRLRLTNSLDK